MLVINPLLLLLEEQTTRIDELEDQMHDLNLALGFDKVSNVQAAFGVSATLARMLVLLAEGKPKNKDQLHAALYFEQPDNSRPEIKILDTQACKLRKHLKPFGVQITTVWSGGYRISAGLDAVRAAVECGLADPAVATRLRRLEYFRERQRRLRAAEGRKDRQTYLQGSLSKQKPWLPLGISRRQWERRRVASLSAANDDTRATSRITAVAP